MGIREFALRQHLSILIKHYRILHFVKRVQSKGDRKHAEKDVEPEQLGKAHPDNQYHSPG